MGKPETFRPQDADPYRILDVGPDAGEEEIRHAYLQKIKEFPPDKAPEDFEKIRDAYETLSDPRRRAWQALNSVDPEAPLTTLLDNLKERRDFVGPDTWLAAMKEPSQ